MSARVCRNYRLRHGPEGGEALIRVSSSGRLLWAAYRPCDRASLAEYVRLIRRISRRIWSTDDAPETREIRRYLHLCSVRVAGWPTKGGA